MSRLTGVIRWEDPPPPANDPAEQRSWAIVAHELRTRPNTWALIDDNCGNPSLAPRIRNGQSWWAPKGAYEATTRVIASQTHVYARFVGKEPS